MQKQIGKYKIQLTIIHTQFKENETGRVFDFQLNVICLIKSLCCCCCGCCCYLSYQWSMLLLLLLLLLFILSRVYVVVVIVICLIKGQCGYWCCCCWLLVLLLVYVYVLMCLFSTSINKIRVTIMILHQHFICLPSYT